MKVTIEGKRYDSNRCEWLGDIDHYSNGNYAGWTALLRAKDGTLLVRQSSNGQDLWLQNYLGLLSESNYTIDDFEMDDEQEARCIELGLIEEV